MMESDAKVVLVTGGGSGLGNGMAAGLLRTGVRVCVTLRGEETSAPLDGTCRYRVDMRDHAALPGLVEQVVREHGRLDAIVCNAAVQGFGAVADLSRQEWQDTIDINLTAPFLLAQAAAPHLKRRRGVIVFVSSVHGVLAAPARTAYAVTKAGLLAMARNMAADLSSDGVRAVALVLGPFASPALAEGASRFFPGCAAEDAIARFAAIQPLGRVGSAVELAGVIRFLMSDAAQFITGTSITIDGGQSSRLAVPELKAGD